MDNRKTVITYLRFTDDEAVLFKLSTFETWYRYGWSGNLNSYNNTYIFRYGIYTKKYVVWFLIKSADKTVINHKLLFRCL